MSISQEPLNEPRSEIWMTRESMVASTRPSTTSVSQSVISTPLSLIFGPTINLLPTSLVLEFVFDGGAELTGLLKIAGDMAGFGMLEVAAGARLPVELRGGFGILFSR